MKEEATLRFAVCVEVSKVKSAAERCQFSAFNLSYKVIKLTQRLATAPVALAAQKKAPQLAQQRRPTHGSH